MPPDEITRKQLQHVITALEAWAKEMRPWADIEYGPINGAWRISAVPNVPTACPFEIVLRPDRKYDIRIGDETYEDQPFDALTDIPQLVRAIASGRVLVRRWESWTTGFVYKIETVVDHPSFEGRFERINPAAPHIEDEEEELIACLESFAPYRR